MVRMYNPPHPGLLLRDAIEALGISVDDFAQKIDVPASTLIKVLNAQEPVTLNLANKFHVALGGLKPKSWLKIQANYDLWQSERKLDVSAHDYLK